MYIYHALINTLSAHIIHINLNMICYTHVEHSPTKTTDTKQGTERQPPPHTQKKTKSQLGTQVFLVFFLVDGALFLSVCLISKLRP